MKVHILDYDLKFPPKRNHSNDAGLDVRTQEEFTIEPGQTIKIPLGFGIELPDGMQGSIVSRSGLASLGLVSQIPPIDSGYTGEISAIMTLSSKPDFDALVDKGFGIEETIEKEHIEFTDENKKTQTLTRDNHVKKLVIPQGARIAQLVITPIVLPTFSADEEEKRGDKGFGSSGLN